MKQETVDVHNGLSSREKRRLLLVGLLFGLIILIGIGIWGAAKREIASFYNDRGYLYWQQENFEEAITYYSKAIQFNPSFAEAYNNRGVVLFAQGDLEGAINDYDKAVVLDIDYAKAYQNRGVALQSQAEAEKSFLGQLETRNEALLDLDKAIELNPDDPIVYLERGRIHAVLYDFDEAINDYSKAIELKPDFAAAYVGRALIKAYSGRRGVPRDGVGALSDFAKAVELGSTDPIIYYNRGKTYLLLRDLDKAIADFDKGLEINPDNLKIYSARGLAYSMAGNKESALADYRLYLELNPQARDRELTEKIVSELEAELADE